MSPQSKSARWKALDTLLWLKQESPAASLLVSASNVTPNNLESEVVSEDKNLTVFIYLFVFMIAVKVRGRVKIQKGTVN